MIPAEKLARWQSALPFWISFLLIPVAWLEAVQGGWTVLLLPLITWYLFAGLDQLTGLGDKVALAEGPIIASGGDGERASGVGRAYILKLSTYNNTDPGPPGPRSGRHRQAGTVLRPSGTRRHRPSLPWLQGR